MKQVGCLRITPAVLKRRSFLRVGSLSLLGLTLPGYLEAVNRASKAGRTRDNTSKAESCILIWLEGGPSQMDTWDPKPNSNFKPISTNVSGIQISELLPNMSRHMDKVSIIRSMQTEESNHEKAVYYGLTGHRPTPAMNFPGLGAIVSHELGRRNQVPPHLVLPGKRGSRHHESQMGIFLGSENDPMLVGDPNQEDFKVADLSLPKNLTWDHLQDRRSFLNLVDGFYRKKVERAEHAKMDQFEEQALDMIMAPEVRQAFDVSQESEKTREAYGRTSFGQSLLLARRLVESGSRFITAAGHDLNGWDTHSDNDNRHIKQTSELDKSLPAFLEDLSQRGLLDSTIVVIMGEFGRSPHHNSKLGRDHWPHCWSLLLGGGGIQGGKIVGNSDDRGGYVAERRVSIGDLFATLYKALGIDWHKEYMSPIGRPVKIANSIDDETGEPVAELV